MSLIFFLFIPCSDNNNHIKEKIIGEEKFGAVDRKLHAYIHFGGTILFIKIIYDTTVVGHVIQSLLTIIAVNLKSLFTNK